MSLLEEITPSPRKVMTLFYIIDTSESMSGTRIGTVNSAMEECKELMILQRQTMMQRLE